MTHVLVVEDDHDHANILTNVLEWAGYHTLAIDRVADAKALLLVRRPDLVLLDLHLPDGIGFDVVDAICARAETCDVPIIVVTADPDFAQRANEDRRIAHVAEKPFDLARLLDQIAQLGVKP